jgi:hypothetical protein
VRGDPKVPYTGALNSVFAYDADATGDDNSEYHPPYSCHPNPTHLFPITLTPISKPLFG